METEKSTWTRWGGWGWQSNACLNMKLVRHVIGGCISRMWLLYNPHHYRLCVSINVCSAHTGQPSVGLCRQPGSDASSAAVVCPEEKVVVT
jgi:hypothetical protein